jgi:hypothetical protein
MKRKTKYVYHCKFHEAQRGENNLANCIHFIEQNLAELSLTNTIPAYLIFNIKTRLRNDFVKERLLITNL